MVRDKGLKERYQDALQSKDRERQTDSWKTLCKTAIKKKPHDLKAFPWCFGYALDY